MSVSPYPGTLVAQIDLVDYFTSDFIAGMCITATNPAITGSSTVYAATAGDQVVFANNSNGDISIILSEILGPIGNLTIFRIA